MKHLSIVEKQLVIHLHVRGFKNRFIAKQLYRTERTIFSLIKKWKNGSFSSAKERRTRRTKLTAQQTFKVLRYFIDHPFHTYSQCAKFLKLNITRQTVGNVLSRNSVGNYVAQRRQFLSMQNQIKRLRFALKYQDWTAEQWMNVSFMDEKTVQTFANGRVLVKRERKERHNPKYLAQFESGNSRYKVNLFGAVSFNGPNVIYSVSTNFTANQFTALTKRKLKDIIAGHLLLDNAKIHLQCIKWLLDSGIDVFNFPPKSPDMNVIENIWGRFQKILNRKLLNCNITSMEELLKKIDESWREIPISYIRQCILSMPSRLKEVIRMKGGQTRY